MVSAMVSRAFRVLAVHGGDIERLGILRRVRMVRAGIDPQIAKLAAAERPVRQHALDSLFDDALGKPALHDRFRGALLDAADMAGVMVIDLLLALPAGEDDLVGI